MAVNKSARRSLGEVKRRTKVMGRFPGEQSCLSLEEYKDCLRSKKREPDLLKEARYERALLYIESGKSAQGRKELEKAYAVDSGYRDVRERLAALPR
jgi:hypothetical protein